MNWTRIRGLQPKDTYAWGLGADKFDNVYITGRVSDMAIDDNNTHAGQKDVFVMGFSPDGRQIMNYSWGSEKDDFGLDVAGDSFGNIYVVGFVKGKLNGKNKQFSAPQIPLHKCQSDRWCAWR